MNLATIAARLSNWLYEDGILLRGEAEFDIGSGFKAERGKQGLRQADSLTVSPGTEGRCHAFNVYPLDIPKQDAEFYFWLFRKAARGLVGEA
jgi:hypothetical protein